MEINELQRKKTTVTRAFRPVKPPGFNSPLTVLMKIQELFCWRWVFTG